MFEFLIALFGGFIYYGLISSEKSIEYNNKKKEKEDAKFRESILCSLDEDAEIIKSLIKGDKSQQMETLDTISDELKEVFGEGWKKYYLGSSDDWSTMFVTEPWGMSYYILASKNGKLPAAGGVSPYGLGHNMQEERRWQVIKTFEIVERNMQKEHPEMRLVFVPRMKEGTEPLEYYEEIGLGSLWWEHELPKRDKKWNPPIKRLW